jgi:hypothetical protein
MTHQYLPPASVVWLFALVTSLLSGCATQGVGSGQLTTPLAAAYGVPGPAGPVDFRWHSAGASAGRGRLTAVLPDGRHFRGTYQQASEVWDVYRPRWGRQSALGWSPKPYAEPLASDPFFVEGVPLDQTIPPRSNRLLGKLSAADGTEMRCWFDLRQPKFGLAGGGRGKCVLSNGEEVVDAQLRKVPS